MKPVILFLFGILSCSLYSQTTNDEYNYVTKGYRAQIENGLPNKVGYDFEKINNYGYKSAGKEYNLIFSKLVKTATNTTVAVMIEYEFIDPEGKKVVAYYCIPHSRSANSIWNKARKQIQDTKNTDLLTAYGFALTKYAAELSN
ncbi:MAG: hypothetical protein HKN48_07465 [Flavobacteriaceae bacterium]|nr:hypothetical protein [Flavobacteriaceae bacterium]